MEGEVWVLGDKRGEMRDKRGGDSVSVLRVKMLVCLRINFEKIGNKANNRQYLLKLINYKYSISH